MSKILDQFGNPIDSKVFSEPQTSELAFLAREFAKHPSRNLTPQRLARILMEAEQGQLIDQAELFEDMEEKDAHIFAEMSKRRRAILTLDWQIEPPRNASAAEKSNAAALEDMVRSIPQFDDVLLDMVDGIGKGYAMLELNWSYVERMQLPLKIELQPASWFQLDIETRRKLLLRDGTGQGVELQPFGWIKHEHKAKSGYISRSGLHRILAWPYLFKNYGVRDLAEFLEIYGLPLRVGKYPTGASEQEKRTLLQAVVSIGHNAAGIIPNGMELDFVEAAKGSEGPFKSMIDFCEKSVSKAVLGGTLTSQADGKSSTHALGKVHDDVRHDLSDSDGRQVGQTLTRDLLYPLHVINIGPVDAYRMPQFVLRARQIEDLDTYANALPRLVGVGMQITQDWAHEKLGIPMPEQGQAVLTLPPASTPAGQSLDNPVAANRRRVASAALSASRGGSAGIDPDGIDNLIDDALQEWRPMVEDLLAPVRDAIDAAHADGISMEELQDRIATMLPKMDPAKLAETLAKAAFIARLSGEADLETTPSPSS